MANMHLYNARELPPQALCYVMDPMCSWCWAFRPVLQQLAESASLSLPLVVVMGGLAPDSNQAMVTAMRKRIEQTWRQIEHCTGARFNYDFWADNNPRRSTYPACRAVIAADMLRPGGFAMMLDAIQTAYYLEARNPSDIAVLTNLAESLDLERHAFEVLLGSLHVAAMLNSHLSLRDQLGAGGYPSLIHWRNGDAIPVTAGYCDLDTTLEILKRRGLLEGKVRRP